MKPQLEKTLANTVLELCKGNINDNNSYFKAENGKIIEIGSQTKLEEIKELFDLGLNPLAVTKKSYGPAFILITDMIAINDNPKLVELALNYITTENLSHLPNESKEKLISYLEVFENSVYLEHLFNNGFRLQQGTKEDRAIECNIAKKGNLEFFEILKFYQPDFNFGKKYQSDDGEYTLSEMIADVASYETSSIAKEKLKNLKAFIDTNVFHSKLDTSIENKDTSYGKAKI